MKSVITWLNQSDKILLVESSGRWNGIDLLHVTRDALAKAPNYLIWDPTHLIFFAENMIDYDNLASERRTAIDLIADALLNQDINSFYIIGKINTPYLQAIRQVYYDVGVGERVFFVGTINDAILLTEKHD